MDNIQIIDLTEPLKQVIIEPGHLFQARKREVINSTREALAKRKTVIWIEGPLGCGKSTACMDLAEELDLACLLEDPEHPVIKRDLEMLYSPDHDTRSVGAWNVNNHYLGFRLTDYCSALRGSKSAALDRHVVADDLYMLGFIEDRLLTEEQVLAIQVRRRENLKLLEPNNPLTAPKKIIIQFVGDSRTFYERKNKRSRASEKESSGGGVPHDYIKRLTDYYQDNPSLKKLLDIEGYSGPLILVPQIIDEVNFETSNNRHLVPLFEAI